MRWGGLIGEKRRDLVGFGEGKGEVAGHLALTARLLGT